MGDRNVYVYPSISGALFVGKEPPKWDASCHRLIGKNDHEEVPYDVVAKIFGAVPGWPCFHHWRMVPENLLGREK